jgi:serine acetyltransferase
VILMGVTIGNHCVVGAGSVVTNDLPDHSVAVGTPARVVGTIDPTTGLITYFEQEVQPPAGPSARRRPRTGS